MEFVSITGVILIVVGLLAGLVIGAVAIAGIVALIVFLVKKNNKKQEPVTVQQGENKE